jgi:putative DNA primase/helicase
MSKLNQQHREHLAQFKISDELLAAAGVRSVSDFETRELLGVNGKYADRDLSGIVFPYFDKDTHRLSSRVRLDHPFEAADGKHKYESEKGNRHMYFPPGASAAFADDGVPVVFCEAEKSALALAALAVRADRPMVPVATGGCWGWRRTTGKKLKPDGSSQSETGPSPDFDLITWKGRRALIAFDANVATNPMVQSARAALQHELITRGAVVYFVALPVMDGVNGPDDYIALLGDGPMLAAINGAKPADEWPEPDALGEDLPTVPAFDLNFLPASLRPMVEDIADRMQVPLDLPAAAAIVALSGCVGRRARIYPKREDSGWEVIPNLWGASIAPPGFLKSPVLHAVTAPLVHIADMWTAEFSAHVAEYESEKEKKDLAHAAWKEQYKQALKKKHDAPVEPDNTLKPPVMRRLLVADSTPEKLQELMVDNPAGLMVLRDELVGLIAEMDKEGRESQRAFFLQCWNGFGSFSVDRIQRGSLHIPHVCLSIFGNIQPSRLRSYLDDALEGGSADDGLLQRFQILIWPDAPGEWHLVDRTPNNTALARVEKIFSRLANLPTESIRLRFTSEAQQIFFDWWRLLEEKVRSGVGLYPALVSHLAKYRSLVPSLAGLFELADLVADDFPLNEEHPIDAAHTKQAVALSDYLEAHARRVYSSITTPALHAARQLAGHIQRGALPVAFTRRDISRHNWSALDTPERIEAALTTLEDAGWVRRAEKPTTTAGGRPTVLWAINPRIPCEIG